MPLDLVKNLQKDYIDKLVQFAKLHYRIFNHLEDSQIRAFFENFKETTLVTQQNGTIRGFAVYVDRPSGLYFIAICGIDDMLTNFLNMLKGRDKLPKKDIYFHNNNFELRKWNM